MSKNPIDARPQPLYGESSTAETALRASRERQGFMDYKQLAASAAIAYLLIYLNSKKQLPGIA